jgi:hypothetical protein
MSYRFKVELVFATVLACVSAVSVTIQHRHN